MSESTWPTNKDTENPDSTTPNSASPDTINSTSVETQSANVFFAFMLLLVRNSKLIFIVIAICTGLGTLMALTAPSEFTSSAKVIREADAENDLGVSGLSLLRGIGVNLGGGSTGMTPDAYPDIINSREVRLAVVRDTFFFQELNRKATFVTYHQQVSQRSVLWDYTLGLPGTIARLFSSPPPASESSNPIEATLPEEKAMKFAASLLTIVIDQDTGLMEVSSTTNDPHLSRDLTQSFVSHLVTRVETIRTHKAKRSLNFISERFDIAKDSLRAAEDALARFDDRNTNPQSALLQTRRARLQRQVLFKSELFSNLQTQLTQAEIDFQRSRPVITLLENPVPPIEPTGPHRLLLIVLGLLLGLMFGVALALIKSYLSGIKGSLITTDEYQELAGVFSSWPGLSRITSRFSK